MLNTARSQHTDSSFMALQRQLFTTEGMNLGFRNGSYVTGYEPDDWVKSLVTDPSDWLKLVRSETNVYHIPLTSPGRSTMPNPNVILGKPYLSLSTLLYIEEHYIDYPVIIRVKYGKIRSIRELVPNHVQTWGPEIAAKYHTMIVGGGGLTVKLNPNSRAPLIRQLITPTCGKYLTDKLSMELDTIDKFHGDNEKMFDGYRRSDYTLSLGTLGRLLQETIGEKLDETDLRDLLTDKTFPLVSIIESGIIVGYIDPKQLKYIKG